MKQRPLIVVVGVCASGKTTLAQGLRCLGYNVRSFAQEHSVSPNSWKRLRPDLLIVLHCRYETIRTRKRISWGPEGYARQRRLLAEASRAADLFVQTDQLSPAELVRVVEQELQRMFPLDTP